MTNLKEGIDGFSYFSLFSVVLFSIPGSSMLYTKSVQYTELAVIIFRFMLKHVNDLYSHVLKSRSKHKLKDWNLILGRIKNQVTLRLVSCCQIASKLTSHYKVSFNNILSLAIRCLLHV